MGRLEGRKALVTGASRGIGRSAALAYAREGADLFLLARDEARLHELAQEIRALGREARTLSAQLGDLTALDAVAPSVDEAWGKLDIFLANGAIIGPQRRLLEITTDEWMELFHVNVLANVHLLRTVHPLLLRSDAGRVIVMSSYAATMALPGNGGYAASKAMLEACVRAYAVENADTPVKVNILNPGGIRTDMRRAFRPDEDPASVPPPEALDPLFIELSEPALSASGTTYAFPEWRKTRS